MGSQVRELLERIRTEWHRSAVWCTPRACSTMRWCPTSPRIDFRTTLAPKAFGAMHLDRLTAGRRSGVLHHVLLGQQRARIAGSGELRRGQRVSRRARRPTARLAVCRRRPSTGVRGRMAAWHPRMPRAPIWALRASFRWSPVRALAPGRGHRARNRTGHRPEGELAAGRQAVGGRAPTDPRSGAAECRGRSQPVIRSCCVSCTRCPKPSGEASSPSICSANCSRSWGWRNRPRPPAGSSNWVWTR